MFNPQVHAHLIGMGFTHQYFEPMWEDFGGPESGPMVQGHEGYDEYDDNHGTLIYVDNKGHVHVEAYDPRDLE